MLLYVLTKSSKFNLNDKEIIGIFSESVGLEKKIILDQIHSEMDYKLEGPFNVDIMEKNKFIPTDIFLKLPSVPTTPLRVPYSGPRCYSDGDSLRLLND